MFQGRWPLIAAPVIVIVTLVVVVFTALEAVQAQSYSGDFVLVWIFGCITILLVMENHRLWRRLSQMEKTSKTSKTSDSKS